MLRRLRPSTAPVLPPIATVPSSRMDYESIAAPSRLRISCARAPERSVPSKAIDASRWRWYSVTALAMTSSEVVNTVSGITRWTLELPEVTTFTVVQWFGSAEREILAAVEGNAQFLRPSDGSILHAEVPLIILKSLAPVSGPTAASSTQWTPSPDGGGSRGERRVATRLSNVPCAPVNAGSPPRRVANRRSPRALAERPPERGALHRRPRFQVFGALECGGLSVVVLGVVGYSRPGVPSRLVDRDLRRGERGIGEHAHCDRDHVRHPVEEIIDCRAARRTEVERD